MNQSLDTWLHQGHRLSWSIGYRNCSSAPLTKPPLLSRLPPILFLSWAITRKRTIERRLHLYIHLWQPENPHICRFNTWTRAFVSTRSNCSFPRKKGLVLQMRMTSDLGVLARRMPKKTPVMLGTVEQCQSPKNAARFLVLVLKWHSCVRFVAEYNYLFVTNTNPVTNSKVNGVPWSIRATWLGLLRREVTSLPFSQVEGWLWWWCERVVPSVLYYRLSGYRECIYVFFFSTVNGLHIFYVYLVIWFLQWPWTSLMD